MHYKNIFNEVSQLMEIDVNNLDPNAKLSIYDTWDSLVVVSTIAIIYQETGVLLKGSDIQNCETLNEICSLIHRKEVIQ